MILSSWFPNIYLLMVSSKKRSRQSALSSPAPSHTRSTSPTVTPLTNNTSPYDATSYSSLKNTQSHLGTPPNTSPYAHTSHTQYNTSSSPQHLSRAHPIPTPSYNYTTHPHDTTNFSMQRFEEPSPFPYHRYTPYFPPTTSFTSSSPYNNTSQSSTSTTASTIHSRNYTVQAQAGSFTSDPYRQTRRESHPQPPSNTTYSGTWGQDDLSGVGGQFGYQDEGYGDMTYSDVEDELEL
ncbi:uncharacterized protein LY89DRAFT_506652 [Mollisia scopiformis]|uniref:Uncharacterized protein n=1 Tax=Mollisia scopiformis TaxID=149040 RepID=A0A194XFC7_MOLSC|nr:uncharacterized protein LY89DRAFT_506652 [Mollisia scopiformis]KUJ18873.1 hypothetical protein LY89DRAFT_506652 [Mollisia scopiformis]